MNKLIYAIPRIKKVSVELTSDVVLVWSVFYTCSVPEEAKLYRQSNVVPCSLAAVEFGQWRVMIGNQSMRQERIWESITPASSLLCLIGFPRFFDQRPQLHIIVTLSGF